MQSLAHGLIRAQLIYVGSNLLRLPLRMRAGQQQILHIVLAIQQWAAIKSLLSLLAMVHTRPHATLPAHSIT